MWLFLNSWFLWAGIAAVIPLVLHLMRQRRKESVPFPTLRFLRMAQKRSSRRMRLEHFLIWFLRTLLIILIVLAFAMPVVRTTELGSWVGGVSRDVAIVWDNSFSMEYRTGNRTVWEDTREVLLGLIEGLERGDRVSIFLTAPGPTPLLAEPTPDLDLALSLIRAERPAPYPGQLAPALSAAVRSLRDSGNREKEIFVLTDGKAQAFRDFTQVTVGDEDAAGEEGTQQDVWDADRVDESIAFFFHLTGASNPQNTTPVGVEIQPSLIMENARARVRASVAQYGPSGSSTVTLFQGNQEVQRRNLGVGEDRREDIVFNLPSLARGLHGFTVETPPDGLTADDRFHFLVRVRDRFAIGIMGPTTSRFFLERALNPGTDRAYLDIRNLTPEGLNLAALQEFPCVFLVNALPLPDSAILALESYVRQGGVLVIFPGDRAGVQDYANWRMLPAPPSSFHEPVPGAPRRSLHLLNPASPLFRSLQLPPGTIPSVSIQRELRWGEPAEGSEVLLGAGRDNAFLQSRNYGDGVVLTFSVSADRSWSDFPLSPLFLPVVHQIVQFSAGVREEVPYEWLDPVVRIRARLSEVPEGSTLRDAEGNSFPIRRITRNQEVILQAENLPRSGIYSVFNPQAGTTTPVLAVNLRREGSDLRPIDPEQIPAITGLTDPWISIDRPELERQIEEHRIGRPLAELLLWLVLLIAVLEWLLANRASRPTSSLGDSLKVDRSGRVLANPTGLPKAQAEST